MYPGTAGLAEKQDRQRRQRRQQRHRQYRPQRHRRHRPQRHRRHRPQRRQYRPQRHHLQGRRQHRCLIVTEGILAKNTALIQVYFDPRGVLICTCPKHQVKSLSPSKPAKTGP